MSGLILFGQVILAESSADIAGPLTTTTATSSQELRPKITYVKGPDSTSKDSQEEGQAIMNALQGAFSSMGGSGASGSQNNEVAGSGDSGTSSGGSSGLRPSGTGDMSTSKFPIVGVFKKYFDGCLEKTGIGPCKFVNLGILGDAAHRARRSCHNSGEAIDIGPLTCAGGKSISTTDPRFYNVARCMAHNTDNKLEIIYYKADGSNMIQKSDHSNHMHIQLKHCLMVTGQYKIGQ